MGYTALETGVRLLPMALTMLVVAPTSARIVDKVGTKAVVSGGLFLTGLALASFSMLPSHNISYPGDVMWRLVIMATGMGLVMAPATESIMGSLPRAKAGVGSAVNDTTRQVGGALGVAVIGSVMTSTYGPRVATAIERSGVPSSPGVVSQAKQSLGFVVRDGGSGAGRGRRSRPGGARHAFVSGLHAA